MRGYNAKKRKIAPDPKYNNEVLAKFINLIMQKGKKTVAQGIVYNALTIIEEKSKKDPIVTFDLAMKNISPVLEVKSRRIGGANYQIPVEVKPERRRTLAMRWIIEAARNKRGKSMRDKLAQELMDAANKQGEAIKKREDVHRMAEANRAFAHFIR